MKKWLLTRRKMLASVLVLTIIGALVSRDFPRAGLVVTVCAFAFYFVYNVPEAVRCVADFKTSDTRRRIRLAMTLAMAGVIAAAVAGGNIYYFLTLVLLGLDYAMESKVIFR